MTAALSVTNGCHVVHQITSGENSIVVPNQTSVCDHVLSEVLVIEIVYDALKVVWNLRA
jgi:hypothetical protein